MAYLGQWSDFLLYCGHCGARLRAIPTDHEAYDRYTGEKIAKLRIICEAWTDYEEGRPSPHETYFYEIPESVVPEVFKLLNARTDEVVSEVR